MLTFIRHLLVGTTDDRGADATSWEAVACRMLRALNANGLTTSTARISALSSGPGREGLRPSELAIRTRMTKQALNKLLGGMPSETVTSTPA